MAMPFRLLFCFFDTFSIQRRWHGGSLSPTTPTRQQSAWHGAI